MKLKTALLLAIIAIFLVMILAQVKPAHFKYQAKKHQITNMDIYQCSRMALNKHHGDVLGLKTISSKDKKYLRISLKIESGNILEVDCDPVTHDLISENINKALIFKVVSYENINKT
jgi:hypothetical protein